MAIAAMRGMGERNAMRSRANMVIFAVFIAEMAATFESAMIFGALPTLIHEYGDPLKAGWLVTMHALISAATYAVAGRLGDIRGRKQIMLGLIAIAACGSVLSAVTHSFGMVLAGRALQGFGSAVLPLSIGILRENLPEERMPISVGLMTTASGAGVVLGLILGGTIIDNLNWHWLFAASAVLLVIAFAAIKLLVPTRAGTPTKHPIDWIEGLLPAPTIMLLLLGASMSKDLGWLNWKVGSLLAGGALLFAYWAKRSLASPEPFIDLRLLAQRNVAAGNFLAVLLALGTANVVLIFSTYIQSPAWTAVGLGLTATMYGVVKLPSNILSFFAGPISGWLIQRRGSRLPVVLGGMLAGTGWLVAMAMPSTWMQVLFLMCWISFGTTLLNAAIPNIIVAAVPPDRTSEAIGTMSVVRGFFTAIGAQVVGLMLATGTLTSPDGKSHFPSGPGYSVAMAWIAITCFVAAACAMLLRGHKAEQARQAASSAT
jgi:MFS family permease